MRQVRGFSLIELMIVVVIMGILVGIAYPTYSEKITRVRRTDGQTALLNLATHLEHYFSENNTYIGATLSNVGVDASSSENYYTLSISNLSASTYTLTATPGGAQATDSCGSLTITHTFQKGPAGCW